MLNRMPDTTRAKHLKLWMQQGEILKSASTLLPPMARHSFPAFRTLSRILKKRLDSHKLH